MKRRKFITLAGAAAGIAIVPPSLYFIAPGINEFAVELIEKEFYYLKLAPGSAVRYVDDYFKSSANNTLSTIKWKTTYYLKLNYEQSDRVRELLKYYLLSTDFFINKMDESKTLNYLGLYSPYHSPLPNPYSFLIYPPAEIKEP